MHGGGDPALLFVHGWSCDRTYWDAQAARFARRHRVVTVDLAGHGRSGAERREWTMAAFGEDVAAVADALGLTRVVLIGHSMGGNVILEAARRLPGRVAGLVWVDTYRRLDGDWPAPGAIRDRLAPFREDFVAATQRFARSMFPPAASPALVDHVAGDMSSAPPGLAVDALEHAWTNGPDAVKTLRELGLPHVAINPGYKPTDAESLRRHGVKAVILPGTGHFLMLEAPDAFNGLLSEAIEYIAGLWTYS